MSPIQNIENGQRSPFISRFVRPAELTRWMRAAGLEPLALTGVRYNPFTRTANFTRSLDVNYLAQARRPEDPA